MFRLYYPLKFCNNSIFKINHTSGNQWKTTLVTEVYEFCLSILVVKAMGMCISNHISDTLLVFECVVSIQFLGLPSLAIIQLGLCINMYQGFVVRSYSSMMALQIGIKLFQS